MLLNGQYAILRINRFFNTPRNIRPSLCKYKFGVEIGCLRKISAAKLYFCAPCDDIFHCFHDCHTTQASKDLSENLNTGLHIQKENPSTATIFIFATDSTQIDSFILLSIPFHYLFKVKIHVAIKFDFRITR